MARLKQQGNGTMITRRRRRKATSATLSQICCPRVNKPIGHDCNASYHSIIIYSLIPAFVPSYQLHCNCWKRGKQCSNELANEQLIIHGLHLGQLMSRSFIIKRLIGPYVHHIAAALHFAMMLRYFMASSYCRTIM